MNKKQVHHLQHLTLIDLEDLAVKTDSIIEFDEIQEIIEQKEKELNDKEPVNRSFRR